MAFKRKNLGKAGSHQVPRNRPLLLLLQRVFCERFASIVALPQVYHRPTQVSFKLANLGFGGSISQKHRAAIHLQKSAKAAEQIFEAIILQ